MSTAIRFLETLACRPLSPSEYIRAVAALEIDAGQRRMLLAMDSTGLSRMLGGRPVMRCMVMAADEDVVVPLDVVRQQGGIDRAKH